MRACVCAVSARLINCRLITMLNHEAESSSTMFTMFLHGLVGTATNYSARFFWRAAVNLCAWACTCVSFVIEHERATYVTEKIEGLGQSHVQHTDALGKQLVEVLPEMLPKESLGRK